MTKKPHEIRVPLSMPITRQKEDGKLEEINELTLHRIKLKSLRINEADDPSIPYKTFLIAASAQMPIALIEEIDLIDLDTIMEALDPFLFKSPQTGKI